MNRNLIARHKKKIAVAAACTAAAVAVVAMTGMAPGGGGGGMPGGGGRPGMEMEESNQKTVVEIGTPEMGSVVVTSSFVGTVEPGQQVTVYPKASGEVLEAHFTVGDQVEEGDVLFRIDATSLEYSIAQTQASIATSQAQANLSVEIAQKNLENYESGLSDGTNTTLMSAENAVRNAEISLDQAQMSYSSAWGSYREARYDYIYDGDDTSTDSQLRDLKEKADSARLQLESAELALKNAKASLEAARKQVDEQADSASDSVAQAQISADLSSQYISLQQQQSQLADYTAASPITGVVEQRNIDPYDMVSSGTAAYVISNKNAMTISFNVAESSLDYMQPGDRVTVEKDGETCFGAISEVSSMVDASSGLYTVKATVASAPFELRSGSIIKLYADTQKVENEMMIPIDAVYYDSGSPYVYLFEDNTAVRRDIETGISDSENIQVVSGLSLSDQLIVTWSAGLMDGAEVYLPGTVPEEAPAEGENPGEPEGERPGTETTEGEEEPAREEAGGDEDILEEDNAGEGNDRELPDSGEGDAA